MKGELIFIGTFGYWHGVTNHTVWETTVSFFRIISWRRKLCYKDWRRRQNILQTI